MGATRHPVIFVFTTAYHPFIGGAEIAVAEIAGRLKGEFRFVIITARMRRDLAQREERDEGTVLRVGWGSRFDKFLVPFLGALWVLRIMGRERPVLFWAVMVSFASGIPYLVNAIRLGKRIPILLTLQEGDSETHIERGRGGLIALAWRLALRRADQLQTISAYLGDLARRYGYRGPSTIIPNGVSWEEFSKPRPEGERQALSTRLGIGADDRVIITTSRLVPKNGVDVLIHAVGALSGERRMPNAKLLVVGDGPERQRLEELAAALGIADGVRFLGAVPYVEVPRYLAIAHVYCRPSRSEGLGSAFLEAMAAGLPVVATEVGGIRDFLRDGENGLAVRVDDPSDTAEKIAHILTDPRLASRLAGNGRKMVEAGYRWETIAGRFGRLFWGLAGGGMPQRILIATGIFPPDIGGPATYSALLAAELPKRGWEVLISTYGPAGISRRIPKGVRHLCYFFSCLWRARGVGVVFAQDPVSAGLPAWLAARLLGRKFAIRIAGDYAWEQAVQRFGLHDSIDDFQRRRYGWRAEFFRRLQRFVVSRADAVITPSDYFRELVSRWVQRPERVHRVYNGVAPSELVCPPGIAWNPRTIFSAGRLVPWKGFAALIDLMPELPEWRLVIAGDGPEREHLELKVKSLALSNRVRITGALPQPEMLRELCGSAVFVLNTSFESFSFQTVAAMAAGVPVVATKIGNLPEIVANGQEGILVEPDNRPELIAAIRKIDSDRQFREMIVANARGKAHEFSIEKTVHQLLGILKRITH